MERSPALLEHEPPMLLGFSWSELLPVTALSAGAWLAIAAGVALAAGWGLQGVLFGLMAFLIGEAATLAALAAWFARIRASKPEGWHLHRIAAGLHFTGWFRNIRYDGRWNV